MRLFTIMAVAALAVTSACGSSGGHASSTHAAGRTNAPAKPAAAPVVKADVPGFSGSVDPSRSGQVPHTFGRCLKSWYAKAGADTRVHVGYPGPASVSVDLTITDQSEPPPEAHKQFTMASGKQSEDLKFGAVPHAGYPQITVMSGGKTLICDAPQH